MNRGRYLATLGSLATVSAASLGTSAFTSAEAERTINVVGAGDESALLVLIPSDNPNGRYADVTGNTLKVNIRHGSVPGDGVHLNAITHFDRLFTGRNLDTQPVVLTFEEVPYVDHPIGNAINIGARPDQLKHLDFVAPDDQPTSDGIYDGNVSNLSNPSPPNGAPGTEASVSGLVSVIRSLSTSPSIRLMLTSTTDSMKVTQMT